jgi:hypothetical protein
MSGALIAQAIERAAGMVGMIRSTPVPTKRMRRTADAILAASGEPPPSNGHAPSEPLVEETRQPEAEPTSLTIPPITPPIDDELASALDAEIGSLVAGRRTKPTDGQGPSIAPPSWTGDEAASAPAAMAQAVDKSAPAKRGSEHNSIFSSFRRALFRS